MLKSLLLSTIVVLFITGCSLGKPVEQPSTYVLVASTPTKTLNRVSDSLRIDYVRSTAPFNQTQMVYRMDEVKFESDYYNRYISEPEAMVGNQVALWLEQSGLYDSVAQPSMRTPAQQILQIVITKLFGDFRDGHTPTAVVEMQFVLIENKDIRPTVVLEKTLSSRVELSAKDPAALAKGQGQAMTQIFEQLAAELTKLEQ
ncbi:ABC-type transport auxiliary lipoprotein family protein [Motilimonas sp. KMU-193]|uniref:ABC-type transport auxiliary lipoprotein family protein n=1 Tax=Motilimonas sp. KMU-193 TaxID=3388668 RepID=UPI00396B0220